MPPGSCAISVLGFGASLRTGSFNDRLAALATKEVARNGGTVDLATMRD